MIEVRRPAESAAADAIVAALKELAVAYREVEDDSVAGPHVSEGGLTVSAPDDISAFLEQLRRDVRAWSAFQSDAYFVEDDGSIC